jgi:diguanylate cyclase (GGDEF)-like protein/PAS domain S-box-containing protein
MVGFGQSTAMVMWGLGVARPIDSDVANEILSHMHGGVLSLDMQGRIITFNPSAERIFRVHAEQVIGRLFAEIFMADNRNDDFCQTVLDAIYQTESIHSRDVPYFAGADTRDISYLNVVTSFIWSDPTPDTPREKRGVIAVFSDITHRVQAEEALAEANRTLEARVLERTAELAAANAELTREIQERKAAQEKLAFLANHDGLTGLANRMLFEEILHDTLNGLARAPDSHGLAVLYFDLDGFKSCNDTLGHAFGDWLLQQVAKRLANVLRETDVPARIGGDEFCAILRGDASRPSLEGLIDRINKAINRPYIDDSGQTGHVGVSIGIAEYPAGGTTAEALVQAADRAMYAAKRAGKNTIRFFSSLVTKPAADAAKPADSAM